MENLNIEETKSTPEVIGDAVNGTLKIKGNCFPENSLSFFDKVNNWSTSARATSFEMRSGGSFDDK